MNRNRKIDKTIFIVLAASVVLCLIAAVTGGIISSQKIGYYTEKSSSVYISSAMDLVSLGETIFNDHVYLTKDITIDDPNQRIGTDELPFEGVFDGQGHTIHFTFGGTTGDTSFFKYIAPGAVVRNVNFVFDDISVEGTSFGGIAKINDGTIENCKLVYNRLKISEEGMFSPLVTINCGNISNVVVSGELIGNVSKEVENKVFFGNVCVYNAGTVSGAIVSAKYSGIQCTDATNVFKGTSKNNGISAVRYHDIDGGQTQRVVAIIPDGQYTVDKKSGTEFAKADSVYSSEKVFNVLDFNNQYWRIDGQDLILMVIGERQ